MNRGVTTGGKSHNFPGDESLWEAPKSPNNVMSTSSIQLLPKSSGLNMGAPNLLLFPGAI